MTSERLITDGQGDDDVPPGAPVVGNDVAADPGAGEPLDDSPVPPLTEPGDTNGG
jgi:hypothetical protein